MVTRVCPKGLSFCESLLALLCCRKAPAWMKMLVGFTGCTETEPLSDGIPVAAAWADGFGNPTIDWDGCTGCVGKTAGAGGIGWLVLPGKFCVMTVPAGAAVGLGAVPPGSGSPA